MCVEFFKWDEKLSSSAVKFEDQGVTSSSDPVASDTETEVNHDTFHSQNDSDDEEYISEYMRPPVTVTVSDGNAFKTVIGDQSMTPGGRYYFEIKINSGYLLKIGVCKRDVDTSKVSEVV